MERGVFSAVPVKLGLRIKMEALVQDLTAALEESSRSSTVRRRWGLRRRARSTGNLPLACHRTQSDDSSSSIGELMISRDRGMSSLHQSDSDDIAIAGGIRHHLTPFSLRSRQVPHLHGNFESDSFNENFSPIHLNTRRYRKRKFKRMAVDPVDSNNPSTSQASAPPPVLLASSKKKHLIRHLPNCENRFNNLMCGKRKRSAREQGMDCDRPGASRGKSTRSILTLHKMSGGEARMDFTNIDGTHCELMSSSSLSSSESDAGIYTNDEGREADDEQSDWFGGDSSGRGGWWEEGDGGDSSRPQSALAMEDTDSEEVGDPAFKAILAGSFEHLSEEAKQAYRAHMMWVREGLSGREIRAGRRRIRGETPGFSIMTSANEKLSRFLQDPDQSELRLHPMQRMEREQLHQLANLYSLNMTSDSGRKGLTCPVLTKTRNTMQAVRVEQLALNRMRLHHHLSDFKRRRKMPPTANMHSPQVSGVVGSSAVPIPESNLGNQMLRGMGWEPGSGLGPHSNGIQEPLISIVCTGLYSVGILLVRHDITSQLLPYVVFASYMIITSVIVLSYVLGQKMAELLIRVFNSLAVILFLVTGIILLVIWTEFRQKMIDDIQDDYDGNMGTNGANLCHQALSVEPIGNLSCWGTVIKEVSDNLNILLEEEDVYVDVNVKMSTLPGYLLCVTGVLSVANGLVYAADVTYSIRRTLKLM